MKKFITVVALIATLVNVSLVSIDSSIPQSELDLKDVEMPAAEAIEAAFPWVYVVTIIAGGYLYYKSHQTGTVWTSLGTCTDYGSNFGQTAWRCDEQSFTSEIKCSPIGKIEYTPASVNLNNF